jgi:hypothetical protein
VPVDLCRAFDAGNKDKHGKALDSAAMRTLAAAAGGEANIPAYCAKVLADQQTPQPTGSGQSTPSASPTGNPSPSRVNGRGHTPPGKARGHSPAQSSPR